MWNSDRETFAAREPHFPVLTAPRFLKANLTLRLTPRMWFPQAGSRPAVLDLVVSSRKG